MFEYLMETRRGLALLVAAVSLRVLVVVIGCGVPSPDASPSSRLDLDTAQPNPALRLLQGVTSPFTTTTVTPSQVATVSTVITPRLRSGTVITTPSYQGTVPPSAWYTPTLPPPGVIITVPRPMRGPLPPLPTYDPRTPTYPPVNPPTIIWGGAEKPPTPVLPPFILTNAPLLNVTSTPTP